MTKFLRSALAALMLLCAPASAWAANLCTVSVTNALTAAAQTAATGLGAPESMGLQASFTYGSGGTTADVYIQSSFDSGTTWWDVANFHFTTATANQYQNLVGMTGVLASAGLTQQTITASTGINGFLGDRLRCIVTTTGTYAGGTSITVNYFARY